MGEEERRRPVRKERNDYRPARTEKGGSTHEIVIKKGNK